MKMKMEMEMKIKVRSEEYEKMTDLSVAMRLDWRVEVETAYFECVPDISFTLCSLFLSPISNLERVERKISALPICGLHESRRDGCDQYDYGLLAAR